MKEYAAVIEVFVQAKQDLLSLIWGPLKLLLQIYESVWPNVRTKIGTVQENIRKHNVLMTSSVTLEHVMRAHEDRTRTLRDSEKEEQFRDRQDYASLKNTLTPEMYDERLHEILQQSLIESGKWLLRNQNFLKWSKGSSQKSRYLWLHGIPGAGKTFIVANAVSRLRKAGQQAIFVFLNHEDPRFNKIIKVLHSILFQALEGDKSLRQIVYRASESNARGLLSDPDTVKQVLCNVLKETGQIFVIVDGLDEVPEAARKHLLMAILDVIDACTNARLLLSSRREGDIASALSYKAMELRVDHHNNQEIDSFVDIEIKKILKQLRDNGADDHICQALHETLKRVEEKSKGMFLYAKLMMAAISAHGFPEDMEFEVNNLPYGLDQAYGRLMSRIESLQPPLRFIAIKVLQWIVSAARPLREEEILQALAIDTSATDFTRGRKYMRDIRQVCGPIIEISNGFVRFVHFSAKQYLLDQQSNHFVRMTASQMQAACTCVAYLSFSFINPLFRHSGNAWDELENRVLEGDFVLFNYASSQLLYHVEFIIQEIVPNEELVALSAALRRLFNSRCHSASHNSGLLANTKFSSFPADVQLSLGQLSKSRERAQLGLANINRFETKYARDEHQKVHERSHKCTEEGCLYAEVGFHTRAELSQHTEEAHTDASLEGNLPATIDQLLQLPQVDQYLVLQDAIGLNQITYAKVLLDLCRGNLDAVQGRQLVFRAGWLASPSMITCLDAVPFSDDWVDRWTFILAIAIIGQNLPNIKFAIEHGAKLDVDARMPDLEKEIHSKSLFWDASLIQYMIDDCGVTIPSSVVDSGHIFWDPAIQGVDEGEAEERFARLQQYIPWDDVYDRGVKSAVESSSIAALRIALKHGGNPYEGTTISWLLKPKSRYGLQMVELLLRYGAKLEWISNSADVRLEKYFGIPWAEIVRICGNGEELPAGDIRRVQRKTR
ncbi:hypothetical protein K469DRAFT_694880 [Zopfia rhizophila CBS 207.26]|uniref:NACHT domain-containing protein n=1 Tax=Zopfia rhizophila CBS 207.26 TaxID=1314779 RepID=A0A6A6DI07_9PEZI|nr:hypothetical protein K469DRAFT_694880 [Zopfia rhizophila CBS 207.26]